MGHSLPIGEIPAPALMKIVEDNNNACVFPPRQDFINVAESHIKQTFRIPPTNWLISEL